MTAARRALAGLLAAALVAGAGCGGEPETPEEQIRAMIAAGEEAVRAHDLPALKAMISTTPSRLCVRSSEIKPRSRCPRCASWSCRRARVLSRWCLRRSLCSGESRFSSGLNETLSDVGWGKSGGGGGTFIASAWASRLEPN